MGTGTRRGLIVGNYCHDVLFKDDVVVAETLGGAVSFISTVLDSLSIQSDYISLVGSDFIYTPNHPPIIPSPPSKTTLFHAHFFSQPRRQDRVLKRIQSCAPITPSHLPDSSKFDFGMAVGVAGEILPETLEKMLDICNVVFVDIQALIRVFDPSDGTVNMIHLKDSGFFHLLPRVGFLKVSSDEAPFVDVDVARTLGCCVVVTNGEDGCRVYWKDGEVGVSPFPTVQVDPTGAGDSFLGGFVAGLVEGLAVPDAALLGNFFGSLTVGQIGLPKFDARSAQRVKDEVQKRKLQCIGCCEKSADGLMFAKPVGHEQFLASLVSAKLTTPCPVQERPWDLPSSLKPADESLDTRYNGIRILFPSNKVYEEPIKSVQTKP